MNILLVSAILILLVVALWSLISIAQFYAATLTQEPQENKEYIKLLLGKILLRSGISIIIAGTLLWIGDEDSSFLSSMMFSSLCLLFPILGTLFIYYIILKIRKLI